MDEADSITEKNNGQSALDPRASQEGYATARPATTETRSPSSATTLQNQLQQHPSLETETTFVDPLKTASLAHRPVARQTDDASVGNKRAASEDICTQPPEKRAKARKVPSSEVSSEGRPSVSGSQAVSRQSSSETAVTTGPLASRFVQQEKSTTGTSSTTSQPARIGGVPSLARSQLDDTERIAPSRSLQVKNASTATSAPKSTHAVLISRIRTQSTEVTPSFVSSNQHSSIDQPAVPETNKRLLSSSLPGQAAPSSTAKSSFMPASANTTAAASLNPRKRFVPLVVKSSPLPKSSLKVVSAAIEQTNTEVNIQSSFFDFSQFIQENDVPDLKAITPSPPLSQRRRVAILSVALCWVWDPVDIRRCLVVSKAFRYAGGFTDLLQLCHGVLTLLMPVQCTPLLKLVFSASILDNACELCSRSSKTRTPIRRF